MRVEIPFAPARWFVLPLALLAALSDVSVANGQTQAKGPTQDISGMVLNHGQPVANAEVASLWKLGDAPTPQALTPQQPLTTDAHGAFHGPVTVQSGKPIPLLAFDQERKLGGFVLVAPDAAGRPVRIELQPLVEVRAQFACAEVGQLRSVGILLTADEKERVPLLRGRAAEGQLQLRLPPGAYRLSASHPDVNSYRKPLVLSANNRDLNLGRIELKPTVIAEHYGKPPPPLRVTDARGVGRSVTLTDYKGRWVLLEFWGFW